MIAVVVFLGLASTTLAQGVGVDASVDAQIKVGPLRPIDLLRQQRATIDQVKDEMRVRQLNVTSDVKTASSGPERRAIMRERREQNEETRDIRGTFRDRLHALVQTHIGGIVRRFNTALDRFDSLVERMESRIEKLQDEDVDTANVEASLAISVGLVDEAKVDVQAVVDIVESVTDESEGDSVREELRRAIREAIQGVKTAHRGLLSTAKMLVEIVRTTSVDISAETDAEIDVE